MERPGKMSEWLPIYQQLVDVLRSFGDRPAFYRWKDIWQGLEVRRCGSTVTQLYIPGQSDLDLVMYFRGREVSRPEQLDLLSHVASELRNHFNSLGRSTNVAVIEAKAPIVQFSIDAGLVVDISVQSILGLANSALVSRYCAASPELCKLARKVKEFATAWGVKSGKDGTLSSYGYTLLCIHFLQNAPMTGIDLSIFPVFPGHARDVENDDPNLWRAWDKSSLSPYLSMSEIVEGVRRMPRPADVVEEPQKQIAPKTLVNLFAHFAAWLLQILEGGLCADDTGVPPYVVSIRTTDQAVAWSRMAPRLDRRAYLAIEEPFSGDNVARPLTYEGAVKMQRALQKALAQLEEHPLARTFGVPSLSPTAYGHHSQPTFAEHNFYAH
jgi:hypothetical protein